jgi:hypothetical protein
MCFVASNNNLNTLGMMNKSDRAREYSIGGSEVDLMRRTLTSLAQGDLIVTPALIMPFEMGFRAQIHKR